MIQEVCNSILYKLFIATDFIQKMYCTTRSISFCMRILQMIFPSITPQDTRYVYLSNVPYNNETLIWVEKFSCGCSNSSLIYRINGESIYRCVAIYIIVTIFRYKLYFNYQSLFFNPISCSSINTHTHTITSFNRYPTSNDFY